MTIVLFGGNGQIGWELQPALGLLGSLTTLGRAEVDMEHPDRLRAAVRTYSPNVIVNAAAYTMVDAAEADEPRAWRVNADAPGLLAEEARRLGALLVHYSTDYVFDGEAHSPYEESAAPRPLGAYGRSKLAGELRVRESGARSVVLRTAWIYASRGKNFYLTIRRLAKERESLRVVADQRGAPTWARSVAQATGTLLARLLDPGVAERIFAESPSRLYHMTCGGETTWFGFAQSIVEDLERPHAHLEPISTHEYPTLARRPRYSVLSNARLAKDFGIRLPHWQEAFTAMNEQMP